MAARLATVFGGSGFIGRYVVQRLARKGWIVRVAVRRPSAARFLKPLGDPGQVVPVAAPLQDEEAVAAAVQGAEAVVNLVAVLYERGSQSFQALHVDGAARIAKAAAAAGARRMVHISAIGADPKAEADYARTKAAGEAEVRAAFPDAVILRPSIVVGPEDDFFNRFAAMACLAPALPLIDGGKTRFQPVCVGDVADAVLAALELPQAVGKTYELGGPKVYTFKELLQLLLRLIDRRRLLLPLPLVIARLQAAVLQYLPKPPLTPDQLRMLQQDNVVSEGTNGFAELGLQPQAIEAILPRYLARYRRGGQYHHAT